MQILIRFCRLMIVEMLWQTRRRRRSGQRVSFCEWMCVSGVCLENRAWYYWFDIRGEINDPWVVTEPERIGPRAPKWPNRTSEVWFYVGQFWNFTAKAKKLKIWSILMEDISQSKLDYPKPRLYDVSIIRSSKNFFSRDSRGTRALWFGTQALRFTEKLYFCIEITYFVLKH